jgi:hypothetical protein
MYYFKIIPIQTFPSDCQQHQKGMYSVVRTHQGITSADTPISPEFEPMKGFAAPKEAMYIHSESLDQAVAAFPLPSLAFNDTNFVQRKGWKLEAPASQPNSSPTASVLFKDPPLLGHLLYNL